MRTSSAGTGSTSERRFPTARGGKSNTKGGIDMDDNKTLVLKVVIAIAQALLEG